IGELLEHGLLHDNVETILGPGLSRYASQPSVAEGELSWPTAKVTSADHSILRGVEAPFQQEGGIRVVEGNAGRAVIKVSAVEPAHRSISAPARVFQSQDAFAASFEAGELNSDMVVVLPFQGPQAVGMPELHRLTPYLGVMQNKGLKVALLTDGRMSGASGKVLAAIHTTPEAVAAGPIGRIRDGDLITIDAEQGVLLVNADLESRATLKPDLSSSHHGMGRELFEIFRQKVGSAETGASVF
ncbi:MAG: dihydroxy-acid dehydratase, partial [Pseudomonadales bacterium]|nr:dihydroxy-acid dehydratase [Pseudomonadales bacterium]